MKVVTADDQAARAGRTLASVLFQTMTAVRAARRSPLADSTSVGALQLLSMRGSHRVSEMADVLGVSQPGITQLVDRLEQRGEVRRRRDEADGRVVLVEITPAGEQRLGEELAAVGEVLAGLLAELDRTDGRRVVDLLHELGEALTDVREARAASAGGRA